MSSMHLLFPDAKLRQVSCDGTQVTVEFSSIQLTKSLRNTTEQTLWHQPGAIVLQGVEDIPEAQSPDGLQIDARVTRGKIFHGAYTYLDSVELPLNISGSVGLELWLEGRESPLEIMAEKLRYDGSALEKYIKHVRD